MSNPFLNYGSDGGGLLSDLQNGLNPIDVAEIIDRSLVPNLPLASNASKKLIARLLTSADLAPGTIPAAASLTSAGGAETLVNDGVGPALATKGLSAGGGIILTSNATAVTVAYNDARLLIVESDTQNIINAGAGTTTFAGEIVAETYISGADPLVSTGTYTADSSTAVQEVAGARFTIAAPQTITRIGVPMIHWPAGNPATSRQFNIWTEAGALVAGYSLPKANIVGQYYTLPVVLPLPAGTYRFAIDRGIGVADILFAALPGVTFDPRVSAVAGVYSTAGYNVFPVFVGTANRVYTGMLFFGTGYAGVVETPTLTGPAGAPVLMASDLDFAGVYSLLRVLKINGLGPTGGVYSETPSTNYVGIVPETNIITPAAGFGSVSVPAGEFQAGDCYSLKIGGIVTCNNGDLWTVRVRSNFGGAAPVTFATFAVTTSTNLAARWWELEVEFSVRAIGVAGVASMSTNGNFTYIDSNAFTRGTGSNAIISTVFSTTIMNTLSVTYQGSDASISVFQPTQIVLARVF